MKHMHQNEAMALIADYIRRQRSPAGPLRILDAGCGLAWPFRMEGVDFRLTGVDVDADSLAQRRARNFPNETLIESDLHSVDLPDEGFDIVYNCYVLEHVQGAEAVLENVVRWLAPGGLMVLRVPDPASVYGHASKSLPFWTHVAYKRHVAGMRDAGKPGHAPFPTIYDPVVSIDGLRAFGARHGLRLEEEVGYDVDIFRNSRAVQMAVKLAMRIYAALSFGRVHDDYINLLYIFRKPVGGAS